MYISDLFYFFLFFPDNKPKLIFTFVLFCIPSFNYFIADCFNRYGHLLLFINNAVEFQFGSLYPVFVIIFLLYLISRLFNFL